MHNIAGDNVIVNFNSHAHVERDYKYRLALVQTRISTHTLTWSVKLDSLEKSAEIEFQLTRSRGA